MLALMLKLELILTTADDLLIADDNIVVELKILDCMVLIRRPLGVMNIFELIFDLYDLIRVIDTLIEKAELMSA